MQRNVYRLLTLLFALFLAAGCENKDKFCENAPDVSKIEANVPIKNLADDLIELQSQQEALEFIEQHQFVADYFFNAQQFPSDSIVAAGMLNIFTNRAYQDTLYQAVKKTFGDFSGIQNDFEKAYQYYQYYYPKVEVPTLQIVLAGLQKDLFVSPQLISIAADYFLGPDAPYVPQGVPDYILRRYQKEYIVPMTMLLLTKDVNETNSEDNTLLADMIFYGKSYYMTKSTLPCTPDSLLIGYTAKEMKDIRENEHIIWANFLENDLLYETSHFMKNKFIGERPTTFEISNQCPGRIGIWVGWRIVEQYMQKNPEVSLQQLMANTNAQEIFAKSGYKPRA